MRRHLVVEQVCICICTCICVFVFVFGGRFEIKQLEVKKATGVHHMSIFGVLLFAICYFLQMPAGADDFCYYLQMPGEDAFCNLGI